MYIKKNIISSFWGLQYEIFYSNDYKPKKGTHHTPDTFMAEIQVLDMQ